MANEIRYATSDKISHKRHYRVGGRQVEDRSGHPDDNLRKTLEHKRGRARTLRVISVESYGAGKRSI